MKGDETRERSDGTGGVIAIDLPARLCDGLLVIFEGRLRTGSWGGGGRKKIKRE